MKTLDRTWDFLRRRQAPRPVLRLSVPASALALPSVVAPLASIVVPVFNQLAHTLDCLRALAAAAGPVPFEVIVVDDASSDGTREALEGVPGLRYLRNEENAGFIRSCNAGAALARGRFLVLLNNDTLVQPGWLEALLDTFDTHPDTGLAGARLLYPDGTLQEAGCVLFADGRAGNYGRLDAALDPRYSHVREVDYCSGAAVAIPLELFRALGGFDERYCPAYYEDADLAMRVREAGRKVRYQPLSWVVHLEGVTSGVSEEHGIKSYQRRNRSTFAVRWSEQLLADRPAWGSDCELAAAKVRRLLVIVDGPDPRALGVVARLRKQGGDLPTGISLFVRRSEFDADTTERLQREGVELWQGRWSAFPRGWVRRYGGRFSAVRLEETAEADRFRGWFIRYWPQVPMRGESASVE